MAHDRWLGKCLVLLHTFKAIVTGRISRSCVIDGQALAVKDFKCTENGVTRGCEYWKFYKMKTIQLNNFQ
jgi:hypothetical protein